MFHQLLAPFRWLARFSSTLFGAPRRLLGLSLPTRVAVLLALFLVLCTLGAFAAYLLDSDRGAWHMYFEPLHTFLIVCLLIAIPLVAYFALRLWLEGETSRFPDIDRAWREGVAQLAKNGIALGQTPLFLVLGARNERAADALLGASGMRWIVAGVPEGRAPLRWFGSDQAVFLVLTDAGCLAPVSRSDAPAVEGPSAGPSARGTLAGPSVRGTMMPGAGGSGSGGGAGGGGGGSMIRGTLMPSVRGTLTPDASYGQESTSVSLLSRELEVQCERLRHVCNLIYRARQPVCPQNGILVSLPWDVIQGPLANSELPEALRRDLAIVRETTGLCCPVMALVTGLEDEPGFGELVRRVGKERAAVNRFGRGFDHWTPPTAENLEALTAHACGAFEDWVYELFRQADGLHKPGNSKLYKLLCKVRGQVQARLTNVLTSGIGSDVSEQAAGGRPQLFGGCYFAATGETEDRQSFVKSVVEKLVKLEEELEWTDEAWARDRFYRGVASVLVGVNALLALAIVGMLVYHFAFADRSSAAPQARAPASAPGQYRHAASECGCRTNGDQRQT